MQSVRLEVYTVKILITLTNDLSSQLESGLWIMPHGDQLLQLFARDRDSKFKYSCTQKSCCLGSSGDMDHVNWGEFVLEITCIYITEILDICMI